LAFNVNFINVDAFIDQYFTQVVAAWNNSIVQCIVAKTVLFKAVYSSLLKLIINTFEDVE